MGGGEILKLHFYGHGSAPDNNCPFELVCHQSYPITKSKNYTDVINFLNEVCGQYLIFKVNQDGTKPISIDSAPYESQGIHESSNPDYRVVLPEKVCKGKQWQGMDNPRYKGMHRGPYICVGQWNFDETLYLLKPDKELNISEWITAFNGLPKRYNAEYVSTIFNSELVKKNVHSLSRNVAVYLEITEDNFELKKHAIGHRYLPLIYPFPHYYRVNDNRVDDNRVDDRVDGNTFELYDESGVNLASTWKHAVTRSAKRDPQDDTLLLTDVRAPREPGGQTDDERRRLALARGDHPSDEIGDDINLEIGTDRNKSSENHLLEDSEEKPKFGI